MMPDEVSEAKEKIDEYLNIIEKKILAPIRNTELHHYCSATLLLLFAAIDGLGKLLHPKNRAGVNERIKVFLDYMGGDYHFCKSELLKLRHSLVHNAINVESFLNHVDIGTDQHLKKIGAKSFIFVNTVAMYEDFERAFQQFRSALQNDPQLLKRAADRLEWLEEDQSDSMEIHDMVTPSPPAAVQFIYIK